MTDYDRKKEKCKNTLRPMAAAIYGHLYQSDNNPYRDELDQVKMRARRAVLAASCICAELNKVYGD